MCGGDKTISISGTSGGNTQGVGGDTIPADPGGKSSGSGGGGHESGGRGSGS
jgi:hypothetical protein